MLWTLVGSESRKLIFPEQYGVEINGVVTGEEIAMPGAPARLPCTEEKLFRVPYSYVDLNGHMNNTRYFDLAEDCIPSSREGKALRLIQTEYVSEARLGDEMTVRWGKDGEKYFLIGETKKPVFRLRLEYEA
jgi:acyl-ACP thioesterase